MHVGDMKLYNHEVLTCMFKYTPPGCLWMPYYRRPFVSKLVMSVLCKKWVTSRDELLASRDNCDTSRDYWTHRVMICTQCAIAKLHREITQLIIDRLAANVTSWVRAQ